MYPNVHNSTIYNSQDMETIQVPINKLTYEDEDINIFMKIYTYNGTLTIKLMFIMPSSRGSSQPRDWTQVSHIAGRLFAVWATREAQL